jgi:translation initiation factor IF-2
VLSGTILRNCSVRVVREGNVVATDKVTGLKRFKDDAKEVATGYECGISLEKFSECKVGDILEAYTIEEIKA